MTTPKYCTRTPRPQDCAGCSQVNYGLDCANNPIPYKPVINTKRARALAEFNGHKGSATIAHLERNIESVYPNAYRDLTGIQYGQLMNVANASYHDGRASAGAEVEADCLTLSGCPLIPLDLLRSIHVRARLDHEYTPIQPEGGPEPLAHLSGPHDFYRRDPSGEYIQITALNVPGTNRWADWQRAQCLLPETLYLRTNWHITNYYIGDMLIYSERC